MRTYSKRELFTKHLDLLYAYIHMQGYGITLGEAYRTTAQQAIYVKDGRSKVAVSQHQKRLAQDLHIWDADTGDRTIKDEEWMRVGKFWVELDPVNNRWGGTFGVDRDKHFIDIGWDRWHFERRG